MIIGMDEGRAMFDAASQDVVKQTPEQLRNQALKFLYDNQECFVAQWVIQNPYANINDYKLKFVYNDKSLMGYTVEMEKIDV